MKKLIILAALAISFCNLNAQSTIALLPSCKQTAHVGDTVSIFAQLLATNRFGSINFSLNPGSPNTPVQGTAATTMYGGTSILGSTAFTVTGLAAGTYVWSVMGKDAAGSTIEGQDSLIVIPALPTATPRSVVSVVIPIGTTTITLPAAGLKFAYTDGSTQ